MILRRHLVASLAFTGIASRSTAFASDKDNTINLYTSKDRREIQDVIAQANRLDGAQVASTKQNPGPLDLAEAILKALDTPAPNEQSQDLAIRAGQILSEITSGERDMRLFTADDAAEAAAANPYEALKPKYISMMKNVNIVSGRSELKRAAIIINSPSAKQRYIEVSNASSKKVPWYIIAALHYREANLNFMGHLHNGDPLLMKTFHVPPNRPKGVWRPVDQSGQIIRDLKEIWKLSAVDSLNSIKIAPVGWTAAGTCWSLEAYNGFGFQQYHVNTPYLWNYTQYYNNPPYKAGGYRADGPKGWSYNYVSKQAGLIALITEILKGDTSFKWDFSA